MRIIALSRLKLCAQQEIGIFSANTWIAHAVCKLEKPQHKETTLMPPARRDGMRVWADESHLVGRE